MDARNISSDGSNRFGKSSWTAASGLKPVALDRIRVGGFLGRRVEANVKSLLAGLNSPMPEAFESFSRGQIPSERGGSRLSDLFKWVEGAAYALSHAPDAELGLELERIADLIQQAMPSLSNHPPSYGNLYVAGHFFQAAVAHQLATGNPELLDLACEWADRLIEQDRQRGWKGAATHHPSVEMGLITLARRTGDARYLNFAESVIGRFEVGETVGGLRIGKHARHAVCVTYLLTALAESALDTSSAGILERLNRLWEELVSTRLYLAGGIGYGEIIPEFPYDLPQVLEPGAHKDVAETCASVGLMMLTWRLFGAAPQSRHFDAIENTLYNHFLGALSLDHQGIFYFNPLRLLGTYPKVDLDRDAYRRTSLPELHRTSCCFTNAWRFLSILPQYVSSSDAESIYINLYTTCSFEHRLGDEVSISVEMESDYPHDGAVRLTITPSRPAAFRLFLRIPAWVSRGMLSISGESPCEVSGGSYHPVERLWHPGTRMTLEFEMPVRAIQSRPEITANLGQIAFARGPLIYCIEQADSDLPLESLCVSARLENVLNAVEAEWRPDFLEGVHVLHLPISSLSVPRHAGGDPYFEAGGVANSGSIPMVPYYARANRVGPSRWITLIGVWEEASGITKSLTPSD